MKSQQVARLNRALKVAIIDSGTTQGRIAKRARIEKTRMSRIVRGSITPKNKEQQALARVLNVQRAELFPVHEEAAAS